MNTLMKTLTSVLLLAVVQQSPCAAHGGDVPVDTDQRMCKPGTVCTSATRPRDPAAATHPGDRATTPNGDVFRISAAEARLLDTPRETYIGQGIFLRTDIDGEPQPVRIPVRSLSGAVYTETVFFEYVGVQVGPQAIDMYGTVDAGALVENERLVGDLFVAVPSQDDNWNPSSSLEYDARYGKAAGYILRYERRGVLHTVGTMIVASDDDDKRRAVDIGSVPWAWNSALGLDQADPHARLHFVVSAPEAHGFDGVGCSGAICENYCAAALPWEIEECGSACCSSGGSGGGGAPNQCDDGIDNDGVGGTDSADSDCNHTALCAGGPPHSHRYESGFNYMFTAKASWCSTDTDPFGEMWARSGYTKQAFRAGTGNAAFDTFKLTNDNVARPVAVKCWTFANPDDAIDCDLNANCGPFHAGSSHPYPFAQKSQSTELYTAAVEDLHHSATVGLTKPISLIQVVVNSFETESGGAASGAANQPGRASVVLSTSADSTSAHEFGHSAGLDHCNADLVNGQWTLMGSSMEEACPGVGSHQRNHFGPTNGAVLHQCLLDSCFVDPSF